MSKRKDTPVTISSTTNSPSCDYSKAYTNESLNKSVITIRSDKSLRCPVSWNSGKKPKLGILDFNTPSVNQRVTEWMGYNDCDRISPEEEKKSSILVRCDFDKSYNKNDGTSSSRTSYKKCSTPHYSYLQKKTIVKNNSPKKNNNFNSKIQTTLSEEFEIRLVNANCSSNIKRNFTINNSSVLSSNVRKMDQISTSESKSSSTQDSESLNEFSSHTNSPDLQYKVPLSPDSQKKEFCYYLQLMHPADKKDISLLQNRRSVRVKNLNILMEKKQLEEQLRKKTNEIKQPQSESNHCLEKPIEIIDLTEPETVNTASQNQNAISKSLKELKINLENNLNFTLSDRNIPEVTIRNSPIMFPLPDTKYLNKIEDFELAVTDLVKHRKKTYAAKKNGEIMVSKFKQQSNKNKKTIVKHISRKPKTMFRRPIKLNGIRKSTLKQSSKKKKVKFINSPKINSLRSKGKLKNITLEKLIFKHKLSRNLINKTQKKSPNKMENKSKTAQATSKNEKSSEKSIDIVRNKMASCEVITILSPADNESVDFRNFVDDISDLENLSAEHRKSLIQNRILSAKSPLLHNIQEESESNLQYFDNNEITKVRSFYETYANAIDLPNKSFNNNSKAIVNELQDSDNTNSDTESVTFVNCKVDYSTHINKTAILIEPKKECDDNEIVSSKETPSSPISLKENNLQAVLNEASTDISYSKKEQSNSNEVHQSELITSTTENNENSNIPDNTSERTLSTKASSIKSVVLPNTEHDYAESNYDLISSEGEDDTESNETSITSEDLIINKCEEVNTDCIEKTERTEILPLNKPTDIKSLHKSLIINRKKIESNLEQTWAKQFKNEKKNATNTTLSHHISISEKNGALLKAFYVDYNLIISQEYAVTFWTQSSLGNILGAQNMWIPKGEVQRLVLNNNCVQKDSMEMIISNDNSVAFVELWTKEHKSDKREGPVADVFATIYFSQQGQQSIIKKMLHLENING